MRRGGNRSGRFLEVAVYDMGGRRGLVLMLEGLMGGLRAVFQGSCLNSWLFLKTMERQLGFHRL